MASIDEKIVSIRFDNDNFERNITSTMSMLDKLKSHLNFSGSAQSMGELNTAANNVDLSPISSAVENISNKFSALGAIGFTAIQSVTRGVFGFLSKMANVAKTDVLGPIITGGKQRAKNIDHAQFMFRGLGIDVEQGMASALAAVKGTAFGLDEAAKVAAQFGASGIKVGDEMTASLRGVAGAAAMTGSSFSEMGDIFASSAGTGLVNNQDLGQFATRGLNAAAAIGKVMGKTEQQIHEMATNGELDFKTFAGAMNEAFGEHATKANETYEGSLANVRAAMSRLGASFFGPQQIQQRDLFNALTPVIDNVSEALKPLINTFLALRQLMSNNLIRKLQGLNLTNLKLAIPNFSKGLINTYTAFSKVIQTVKTAFRDIFPKSETSKLVELSKAFLAFTERLKFGSETANKIRSIFGGIFSVFKIGIEIVKGIFGVFKTLFAVVSHVVDRFNLLGDGVGSFASRFGATLIIVKQFLVEGGGLQRFFAKVSYWIIVAGVAIAKFVGQIGEMISGFKRSFQEGLAPAKEGIDSFKGGLDSASDATKRIRDRFSGLLSPIGKVFGAFGKIGEGLGKVFGEIGDVFAKFKEKLDNAFKAGDYDGYVDILNVGLIGGVLVVLRKFINEGLSLDLSGGLVDTIKEAIGGLTDTLSAMQMELKAKALMEIAIAIGVLTLSVMLLATIDSVALTKALTAIAVGMGQLMAAMALMSKMDITGIKIIGLAAGLILLAAAILVLSIAVKIMSTMGWEELAKGLIGVAGGILILVAAAKLMDKDSGGMIRAGIAMIAMSAGLIVLSFAVKSFSDMSWEDLAKGLAGAAVGILLITRASNHMPKDMVSKGAGLILLATGLRILANAVKAFGSMSWEEMGQGLAGLAASLLLITVAVNKMPPNMPLVGAGLILIGIALNLMALAVKGFSSMDMDDLARGIGAVGLMLWLLSAAANSMSGAALGAVAIIVVAGALHILVGVLERLGQMSIAQIAVGLGALSLAFIIIGLAAVGAAHIAPALFVLAASLLAIGLAALIFGVGAILIATSFAIFAEACLMSAEAVKEFISVIKPLSIAIVETVPRMVQAFADGLLQLAQTILDGAPPLLESLSELLTLLIEELVKLVPKLGELIAALLDMLIDNIREFFPRLVELGFEVITALLSGISENIEPITQMVIDILTKFMDTMTENMPMIIESGTALIVSFLDGIAANINQIVAAGVNIIVQFLAGVNQSIPLICAKAIQIIISMAECILSMQAVIIAAGTAILIAFITGIGNAIGQVITKATDVIIALVNSMAANANRVVTAGFNAMISFAQGITNNLIKAINAGADMIIKLVEGITGNVNRVITAGSNAIISFMTGISNNIRNVIVKGADIIIKFVEGIASNGLRVANAAADAVVRFVNGLATAIETHAGELRAAGMRLAMAIADGMTGGLASKAKDLAGKAASMAKGALDAAKGILGIGSPSKEFYKIGAFVGEGLGRGMDDDIRSESAASSMAKRTVAAFQDSIKNLSDKTIDLNDISPTIAPVLDLTKVELEARRLSGMMGVGPIVPEVSYDQARHIAHTTDQPDGSEAAPTPPPETRDVTFEQHIYSPKALSTVDIYRNTKSQIAMAKEELGI